MVSLVGPPVLLTRRGSSLALPSPRASNSATSPETVPRPASRIEVAERWQGVSVEPFERVVAEHAATVLRVCRAVLGAPTDADDAWSETFLSALQAYPRPPDDANVEAWLVTIAHRKAIDVIRSAARRATPVAAVADGASPSQGTRQGPRSDSGRSPPSLTSSASPSSTTTWSVCPTRTWPP